MRSIFFFIVHRYRPTYNEISAVEKEEKGTYTLSCSERNSFSLSVGNTVSYIATSPPRIIGSPVDF